MGEPLIVIGAGGHAAVVVSAAQAAGLDVQAIFDDNAALFGRELLGVPVLGTIDDIAVDDDRKGVIAIGSNGARESIASRVTTSMVPVVHPDAVVQEEVTLGGGTVVFAGAVRQPRSRIGLHSIVNTGATIDHDCRIGSFVHVAPGATICGDVHLGSGVFLGAGSTVIPGVRVAPGVIVGAGAVVVQDLLAPGTYVGTPARLVHSR